MWSSPGKHPGATNSTQNAHTHTHIHAQVSPVYKGMLFFIEMLDSLYCSCERQQRAAVAHTHTHTQMSVPLLAMQDMVTRTSSLQVTGYMMNLETCPHTFTLPLSSSLSVHFKENIEYPATFI